ncbi:FIMAH domain-containing protein [Streptosporangium subroseum]|uniref:FIMAH domain-containing protein n=1 Tax=Streptosporangium subroseum TaxID=106412 RepID=UPI00308482FF|nr:hypothetical protein OHB15_10800 [Streptosporangium subroseum]
MHGNGHTDPICLKSSDNHRKSKTLSQKGANKLRNQLTKVLQAEVKGNDAKTVKALEQFRAVAVDATIVTEAEVRQVLARDTDALIARLS